MWVVYKRLQRFELMAPAAWFGTEEDANEYVSYLGTVGVGAEVKYERVYIAECED